MSKAICDQCGKPERSESYKKPEDAELTCSTCVQDMIGHTEEEAADEVPVL